MSGDGDEQLRTEKSSDHRARATRTVAIVKTTPDAMVGLVNSVSGRSEALLKSSHQPVTVSQLYAI